MLNLFPLLPMQVEGILDGERVLLTCQAHWKESQWHGRTRYGVAGVSFWINERNVTAEEWHAAKAKIMKIKVTKAKPTKVSAPKQ